MRSRAFIGETLLRRYLAGDQHALKEEMALNVQTSCGYCTELKRELDYHHSSEGKIAEKKDQYGAFTPHREA